MSLQPRTLRVRLAVIGLAGILVPLLVLLAVSMVSNETQATLATGDGTITQRTRQLSPWVPITAALLALPAAALAWWWAGRAVEPLQRLTDVADDIQLTSLDRRIGAVDAPDEVAQLAASFDRMLNRLEMATTAERRFVEDVSHQLRTPLAVLSANADVALAETSPTVDDLTRAMHTTKRVTAQLSSLVEALLVTARAEQHSTRQIDTDLVRIAADAADACAAGAAARGVTIVVIAPHTCLAAVDGPSIRRAVDCLVENAIQHSPADATVTITVGSEARARPYIAVTDQGPGIDPDHQSRIFDRYWSNDDERSGLGIGLAIVKQIADAHDGVEVTSPLTPTGGTRFTMRFHNPPSPIWARSVSDSAMADSATVRAQ